MNMRAVRIPPPTVGQLKTGEYVIFNMQDTPLWDATFPTRKVACEALAQYFIASKLEGDR